MIFRPAGLADLDRLVALEEAVERSLPSRDMFATDGRDFYEPIVAGAGRILLAEDEADGTPRLAGASVIRYPASDEEENLGLDAGLAPALLSRVRHLESVFVHSAFQGRGLAEKLIRANMAASDGDGRDISLATAWPFNIPSLRLHLTLGMHVAAFALKYGGRPRFVLLSGPDGARWSDESTRLPLREDLGSEAHAEALALGLRGTALIRLEGGWAMEYRKPLA